MALTSTNALRATDSGDELGGGLGLRGRLLLHHRRVGLHRHYQLLVAGWLVIWHLLLDGGLLL